MPQILRTILQEPVDLNDNDELVLDLPVNPLSVVLLTVRALNDTVVPADYTAITRLLELVNNVRIAYRGANIINGRLDDLAVMYGCLSHWMPAQGNMQEVDNATRMITVPLVFGRRPYDHRECFPATRRGDLIMTINSGTPDAGLSNRQISIETVELLEAAPERFIKVTTTRRQLEQTGEYDIEMPIGNDLLGALLYQSEFPNGASFTSDLDHIRLQVDNVEVNYSDTSWISLHGELYRKLWPWPAQPHTHGVLAAPGTTRQQQENFSLLDAYAYMDLDPLEDGQYALKTAGAARINLRNESTAADPGEVRVLPVELVMLGAPGQPASA